jgi:hypothetical protein
VQPNSQMSINAVEGFPLEDFSAESVRSLIAEAQKIANGSGSEVDIAEAKIELEVSRDANRTGNENADANTRFRCWRASRLSSNKCASGIATLYNNTQFP